MSYIDKIREFKSKISEMKQSMIKLQEIYENPNSEIQDGLELVLDNFLLLSDIRQSNCEIQKEIEIQKESINKQKESVDEKNLNYQNYRYQKENIISQINSCNNFNTKELNKIKLPEIHETLGYLKESGKQIEESYVPSKIDFLNHELNIRKSLNEKVKNMAFDKDQNQLKLREKEKFLKELPIFLNSLETNSLKAQEILDLKITESIQNSNLIEKLPNPLFTLYYSLVSTGNIEGFEFELKIQGKQEKLDEFYCEVDYESMNFSKKFISNLNNDKSKEEGEAESGEEDNQLNNDKKLKKKRKRKLITNYEQIKESNKNKEILKKIPKFPLSLQLNIKSLKGNLNNSYFSEIEISDLFPVTLNFYFIPIFNIVTCEAISKNPEYLSPQILSNIFVPQVNLATINSSKKEIELALLQQCEEIVENEKFFDYLQILTKNINFSYKTIVEILKSLNMKHLSLNETRDGVFNLDPTVISTDNFINSILRRCKVLPILISQIDYISKNKKLIPEVISELKQEKRYQLIKEKTNIVDFIKISQKDFLKAYSELYNSNEEEFKFSEKYQLNPDGSYTKMYIKEPLTFYNENEAFYYILVLERNNFKMISYIEIGFDYPIRPPKFLICLETQKKMNHIPESLLKYVNSDTKLEEVLKNLKIDNSGFTLMLRDIENEVNFDCAEFCTNEKQELLLSYQIRHLQMCFDIFVDTENSSKITLNYNKPFKGKLQKRPFSFNLDKNIFESK